MRPPQQWAQSGTVPNLCLMITMVGCGFRLLGNDVTVSVIILPHCILLWDSVGVPGASAVESICSAGLQFNPWGGKICWRRKWQPTPVILFEKHPWTEEAGGLQSIGSQESHTTRQLNCHHHHHPPPWDTVESFS